MKTRNWAYLIAKLIARCALGCVLLWLIVGSGARACADDGSPPTKLYVLLKHGEVLCGSVVREPEHLLITQHGGIQLRLPRTQVRFVGANMTAVYRHRLGEMTESDADAHLDMASWCLLHELRPLATHHVIRAASINAEHPRLAELKARLEHALDRTRHRAAKSSSSRRSTVAPGADAESAVTPKLLKSFAGRVQPMLLNRCGAAHCHGYASETTFQLCRVPTLSEMPRQITLRNLAATLRQIDHAEWDQSPLLIKAEQPHGRTRPQLRVVSHQTQHEVLQDWVADVVREKDSSASTALGNAKQPRRYPIAPAVWNSEEQAALPANAGRGTRQHDARKSPPVGKSPHIGVSTNKIQDPFDPERFNRQSESSSEPVDDGSDHKQPG